VSCCRWKSCSVAAAAETVRHLRQHDFRKLEIGQFVN
jgi:hypothetical protein